MRAYVVGALVASIAVAADRAPVGTFEDIYGPSGESFQAALGFRVFEGDGKPAGRGYGVGVDDMVVQWREFKLVEDATSCATSGACASIVVDAGIVSGGEGLLKVRILDASPYGAAPPADRNDCDGNGSYLDPGDDTDCDDDGVADVVFRVTSLAEPQGETFAADRESSGVYAATVPYSATATAAGVVRIAPDASGREIRVHYEDRWDGGAAGERCKNSPDPAQQGFLVADVEIALVTGDVAVVLHRIEEVIGDMDGFPDTNETFDLYLSVKNRGTAPLTHLVVRLASSDPKIDCVLSSLAAIPFLDAKGTAGSVQEITTPFRVHVAAAADRAGASPPVACSSGSCSNGAGTCGVAADCVRGLLDAYAATLDVSLAADQFDVQTYPQALQVELDLDAAGPAQATATFVEGFESGLGNFAFMNLDVNRASNSASDGYRCQYNDPDFVHSNSYGDSECYLGFVAGQNPLNDWHSHTTAMSGGRAYLGTRSLHFGRHVGGVDTLPLSQLDAVRTLVNVNLAARVCRDDPAPDRRACNTAADCLAVGGGPCVSAVPQLSFKHQLGVYARYPGRPTDRAVVQAQVAGSPTWENIAPYQNAYTGQASDLYSNCTFDPVDDGNDEDDYFDPADPWRRFGPSSTCFPEFVFDSLGDTDEPFQPHNIRNASDGPGLQGALGIGTWVESRFDLSRFRGRSMRLRFLFTSIKVADLATYEALFMWNPTPDDDGWYVDDVRVTETLGLASATPSLDGTDNSALPSCPSAPCSTVVPSFSLDPSSGTLPGRPVTLSAAGSLADRCSNGALLFRFFEDRDASGTYSPGDVELAPFATAPIFVVSPTVATRYGVTVRCSEGGTGSCLGADATAAFSLACAPPPPVYSPALWWTQLRLPTRTTLSVPPHGEIIDVVRGDLGALRASGTYAGSAPVCLRDDGSATTLVDATLPGQGQGFYYLVRGQRICNDHLGYGTFSPRENPTSPGKRDAELLACPP